MILKFLQQQIFPGFYADYCNSQISKIYEKQKNAKIDVSKIKGDENKYVSKLQEEMKIQLDRKVKIEDKAKSLLFIITLAITTITFSLSFLKQNSNEMVPLFFILVSIVYFVLGGLRALQTFNIKQFHVSQTSINIEKDKFVLKPDKKAPLLLKELILSKALNDQINSKTSNLTYASFILIRNGLIMFLLFFISTIAFLFFKQ
jgi:hypothetical protein